MEHCGSLRMFDTVMPHHMRMFHRDGVGRLVNQQGGLRVRHLSQGMVAADITQPLFCPCHRNPLFLWQETNSRRRRWYQWRRSGR